MSYQNGAPVMVDVAEAPPPAGRSSPASLSSSLRRLFAALGAVVLLALSLAPEAGTQTRWSDSSYWTVERTAANGDVISTSYAFRGDLYQGALSGYTTTKAALTGAATTAPDLFLSGAGSLWDSFTSFGCLSKALATSDACSALSTLLGMSVFVRIALVAALLALLHPLLRLAEALLLARWCGEENAADALVRAGSEELRVPALVALCCTVFCLVAWPSAVSGALASLRVGWRAYTGVVDTSATALLVRPGGGFFCVVGAALAALWLWRDGQLGCGGLRSSWGGAVAPWAAKPAAGRPKDDLAAAYAAMGGP
jgi:hypothetical protein